MRVTRRNYRPAFTLTELLVVIAILALLASLAAWGVFAMIGNQRRRNTENTVRILNKMLQSRWAAVIADAKKESVPATVLGLAGGDPERARVIWIKVRLVEAFPMRYDEVAPRSRPVGYLGPFTVVETYIPFDRRKPHQNKYHDIVYAQAPAAAPWTPLPGGGAGESSACLLMALRTLQGDGIGIDDQIKYAISNTDGANQINTVVDGWGKHLAFFRFAWKDPNLQAATPGGAATKFADPIDNTGKLIDRNWYFQMPPVLPVGSLSPRQTFEAQFHWVADPQMPPALPTPAAGPARGLYVWPVIASAGRDGKMDLVLEPISRTTYDLPASGPGSKDNIFSYQLTLE